MSNAHDWKSAPGWDDSIHNEGRAIIDSLPEDLKLRLEEEIARVPALPDEFLEYGVKSLIVLFAKGTYTPKSTLPCSAMFAVSIMAELYMWRKQAKEMGQA